MTIPNEPLTLKLNTEDLTLDEVEMFSESENFRVSVFKKFMAKWSNWTKEQTGALTLGEMKSLAPVIAQQLNEALGPKEKPPR
jgi:hypothetical protein